MDEGEGLNVLRWQTCSCPPFKGPNYSPHLLTFIFCGQVYYFVIALFHYQTVLMEILTIYGNDIYIYFQYHYLKTCCSNAKFIAV